MRQKKIDPRAPGNAAQISASPHRSQIFKEFVSDAGFSLLMGSPRKNGRLGDPALPSLSSNSFHVKHFQPQFLEKPVRHLPDRSSQRVIFAG